MAEADIVDLEDEPDDAGEGPSSSPEVQFLRATVRHPQPPPRRWEGVSLFQTNFPLTRSRAPEEVTPWARPRLPRPHNITVSHLDTLFLGARDSIPNMSSAEVYLDYTTSSFPMETAPTRYEDRRRRDTYKPPSPAPEGFSRTLGEDDVAVCPNCDWELGTGEGKKQEIWLAKQCGHVRISQVESSSYSLANMHILYSRYTVVNAQRTGPFPRPERPRHLQRPSLSPSARSRAAASSSVHPQRCSISTCDASSDVPIFSFA
jgi:hypothetical protein